MRAFCILLVLIPSVASAQRLDDVRRSLSRYDLDGGTARVIAQLGPMTARGSSLERQEARFLRAAAATDLLLLAGDDAAARAEVARAYGVEPDALERSLDAELAAIARPPFIAATRESRWVLTVLASPSVETLRDGRGVRRDVLYVRRVVDALGDDDEVARLAALGHDFCGNPGACTVGAFTPRFRRAAGALREARAAMVRIERAAQSGEPLTSALAALTAVDATVLDHAAIRAVPRFDPSIAAVDGARGAPMRAELVLVVGAGELRYGFVPTLTARTGTLAIVGPSPALPATEIVGAIDVDMLPALTELRSRLADGARVGVAGADDVDAGTMSRVLTMLSRAGFGEVEVIGVDGEGEARSVTVRVTEEETNGSAVYVRLGGYTISSAQGSDEIPRVRVNGRLTFDTAALAERVTFAPTEIDTLRYMSAVAWPLVLEAAFHVAPRDRALAVAVP
jgi:hypothetical protein